MYVWHFIPTRAPTRGKDGTKNQRTLDGRSASGTPGRLPARTPSPATAEGRPAALPPVGSGRHATIPAWQSAGTEVTARAPQGIQQWCSLGAHVVRDQSPAAAVVGQTGVPPPAGRRWRTAVLAWMSAGAGGTALATGGLQQPEFMNGQQGERRVLATAATRGKVILFPAAVPPPERCDQVRVSTGEACAPARSQHGSKALLAGRVANSRLGSPPTPRPSAEPGSGERLPMPAPPPPLGEQRMACDSRSDPTEIDSDRGEAPQALNVPR